MQEYIFIKGAREHNLKNIDVTIPRDKITVITGPSGSGKSSLAMDTIYAEGQRRYVESLSIYARQFLEQTQKPEVDYIEGLSPAIAIDQKTVVRNPRSTVGTITEIYDYMRVLYTKIGIPHCYQCGSIITTQDLHNIIRSVLSLPAGTKVQILAPIVRQRKGEHKKELGQMRIDGFVRARIDKEMVDLTQDISLNKQKRHTIEIVIDRFIMKYAIERQIRQAIDTSLKYANTVIINLLDENKDILFSKTLACLKCGISYPEIEPMLFSFNSRYGACLRCKGLGFEPIFDSEDQISEHKFEGEKFNVATISPEVEMHDFTHLSSCKACSGVRLRKEALGIKLNGVNIGEFSGMSIKDAHNFVNTLKFSEREIIISRRILKEIKDRLSFLKEIGLDYLTLSRSSLTLSGGETQRIRLATQIGSSLTGVLYVLDEPSIGLHPKDCARLLGSLCSIRDAGNTVIIVEHDEEIIKCADHIIDMGPGAGKDGGRIIAAGTPLEIIMDKTSITGNYLSGQLTISTPKRRRKPQDVLNIKGATEFNLKNINVSIPLKVFLCITGVSGSGKSTLIFEVLYKAITRQLYKGGVIPGRYKKIEGMKKIDKVICIDQSPIGKTPRSNPATYTGILTFIRDLFSQLPDSRLRGYKPSRFSFNVSGGRCETCHGAGLKKIEMHFLSDVYVTCDICKGRRYNKETLEIHYKNKSISDTLEMTISESLQFFNAIPPLKQRLDILEEMGMGYLKLGQPATTLSGGEAQRLKLSKELGKKTTCNTLYILDEPTTGLHYVDKQRLLGVINRLVDLGNTVIVIEHDLDIIKSADYIIDMGPEGGDKGGRVVATGTPEEIIRNKESHTGRFLSRKLK